MKYQCWGAQQQHSESHLEVVAALKSTLPSLTNTLDWINRSVEPDFVSVGESLQMIFSQAAELTTETGDAVSSMGGDSGQSGLVEVDDLAKRSLAALKHDEDTISHRVRNVGLMVNHLANLDAWSAMLAKISKMLRAVSIYFAVEGSRSSDLAATFSSYTQELRTLADDVYELAGRIRSDSTESEAKQKSAHAFICDGTSQLRALSEDSERTVTAAVRNIDRLIGLSVQAMMEIAEHSKKVSQWVSSIVMAIQFHDITRQQVEHVVSALQDIEPLFNYELSKGYADESSRNAALGRIFSILSLQSAQLKHVVVTIQKAHDTIDFAFKEIAREAKGIAESMVNLVPAGSTQADASSPFFALKSALLALFSLIEKDKHFNVRANEAAEEASKVSVLLSDYVTQIGDINEELKIKALNATVKSFGLADTGKAISVLAREVMSLSKMCDGFMENVAKTIRSISELVEESETFSEGGEREEEEIVSELNTGIERVTERYEQFVSAASSTSAKSEELQQMIMQTESGLSFLLNLSEKLTECQRQVEVMSMMLQPWQGFAPTDDAMLEQQAGRYTMENEREVHLQALSGADADFGAVQAAQPGSQLADSDDEFGDNVELF